MSNRVNTATRLGQIPEDIRKQHKGFCEWDLVASKKDHPAIVQILIDGSKPKGEEIEVQLPTLVYLSRKKRPQYHHNFEAGAMNALIRVYSKISNSPIILNLDCDMYPNNSESVRDALCLFIDEEQGHQIAFVQYPQCFHNHTRSDIYGSYCRMIYEVELPAMDSYGGPCYIGTGQFKEIEEKEKQDATVLEETCKIYASCTYEENTPWGKERGLKYGFAVEDIATGLSIQSKGWKSVFFYPERIGLIGTAPTTLLQSLERMKRWSEGQFQIFLSKYGPLFNRRLSLKHLIAYARYNLWAPNCLPTLYYVIIPTLFLLRGISLFVWVIPFTYVFVAKSLFSLGEFLYVGGAVQGWWNEQRMWLYRRTASFLFGFLENISSQLGFAEMGFVVTSKVADDEINVRYKKEVMEFGAPSLMFTILATIATLNLVSFGWVMKMIIVEGTQIEVLGPLASQIVLCGLIVLINLPLYHAHSSERTRAECLEMAKDGYIPFDTTEAKGRALFQFYVFSVLVGICWIWIYRGTHIPASGEAGRWPWFGLFLAHFWFGLYWILPQSRRWNPIFRRTSTDSPPMDVFVCTADRTIEPPLMVSNTALSVMAYDYPPEKLSVCLSDNGGSELTSYALSEATRFAKHWLPFCRKFKVEPRSPAAYFSTVGEPINDPFTTKGWLLKIKESFKLLYDEMKRRIENATMLGQVPKGLREELKGFQEWDSFSSRHDHHTILQIVIDGTDFMAVDIEGQALPTLVYLARQKRPQCHHNFNAH
ncbi:Cellulose synthase (UDP-forming) [Bertholletia excelsa]